jgi:hypothetical protein
LLLSSKKKRFLYIGRVSMRFFFEEKKQKTFVHSRGVWRGCHGGWERGRGGDIVVEMWRVVVLIMALRVPE